jgi:hypothetical protein
LVLLLRGFFWDRWLRSVSRSGLRSSCGALSIIVEGGVSGLKAALAGGVWAAIMAAVALALIAKVGGGPLGAAICVGMTVAIFILGANFSLLAVIPAAVYGYSAVAASALLKPGGDIFSVEIVSNPVINIVLSMIIGSLFAFVSEKIVEMLATQSGAPVRSKPM